MDELRSDWLNHSKENEVRRLSLAVVALILAGCETPAELTAYYMNAQPLHVCEKALVSPRSDIRAAAGEAIARRSIDCRPYVSLIAARQQANQAQLNQGLLLLQQARPQPSAPPSNQVTCRSFNRGTYIQTICN